MQSLLESHLFQTGATVTYYQQAHWDKCRTAPAFTVIENFKCFKQYILEPKYAKAIGNHLTFTKNFIIKNDVTLKGADGFYFMFTL